MKGPASLTLALILVLGGVATCAAAEPPRRTLLTLRQAIALALERNRDYRQSANGVASAEIALAQSRSGLLPEVGVTLDAARRDGVAAAGTTTVGATVGAQLNLFNGFGDRAGIAAAGEDLTAERQLHARARQTLIETVTRAYVDALTAWGMVVARREDLNQNRSREEETAAAFRAGKRPMSDLYQQQAATAAAEAALVAAERDFVRIVLQAQQTLGVADGEEIEFAAPASLPAAELFNDLVAGGDAGAERPDLRARAAEEAAATARIAAARSGAWPTLDLALSAGSDYAGSGLGGWGGEMDDNRYAAAGLTLTLPLFDRHRTRHAVAAAGVALENARLIRAEGVATARREVATALLDYTTVRQQGGAAERQLLAARQARAAMEERYRVGAATMAELLQVRSAEIAAMQQLIEARYALLETAMVAACAAGDSRRMEEIVNRWEALP